MDISVRRNAFGRQRDSFEIDLTIPVLGKKPFPGVFIRAPLIEKVKNGDDTRHVWTMELSLPPGRGSFSPRRSTPS